MTDRPTTGALLSVLLALLSSPYRSPLNRVRFRLQLHAIFCFSPCQLKARVFPTDVAAACSCPVLFVDLFSDHSVSCFVCQSPRPVSAPTLILFLRSESPDTLAVCRSFLYDHRSLLISSRFD